MHISLGLERSTVESSSLGVHAHYSTYFDSESHANVRLSANPKSIDFPKTFDFDVGHTLPPLAWIFSLARETYFPIFRSPPLSFYRLLTLQYTQHIR
jgi:hypothetical protein